MKHLQLKYNLLQILFWLASCAACGYVAVFLQYKGLSNTEIGIVTGVSCLLNMFLSPFLSGLIDKIPNLTITKLVTFLFGIDAVLFLVVSFMPLSKYLIMLCFMLVYSLNVSVVPFLSTIAMDYIKQGIPINFGVARGMGSVSYATSAMLLGYFIEWFNPVVLGVVFLIGTILFLLVLFSMPKIETNEEVQADTKSTSIVKMVGKYPTFFFLLLGFSFMFAAACTLATYLIDIVHHLGGNTSFYGIAVFCMAASEMPIMAITPRLMRRYNSVLLIMAAAFFYIVRNFLICLSPNLPFLLIGMACQSLSYALITGVITYYVTYHLEASDQINGQTMIAMMTTGLGSMIGNVFGGFLSDAYGIIAMYIFACVLTVLGAVIIWITGSKQGKKLLEREHLALDK